MNILVIRLGAMGDVIHALPAVASLKLGFSGARVKWLIEPRWTPLLESNPYVDNVIRFNRRDLSSVGMAWRALRRERWDLGVDFQGLIKSAIPGWHARPERLFGFDTAQARERAAAWFYSDRVHAAAEHVVDRNLELAQAAGAEIAVREFPIPEGTAEGELPRTPFVLASPLAGWGAKQWPLENYSEVGRRLSGMGYELVVNAPKALELPDTAPHVSGLAGLIQATRRAAAVLGVDSGPLHLAAALGKPGVALFGPTDPARNGPYGGSLQTIRIPGVETTYRRGEHPAASMRAIRPEHVFEVLVAQLRAAPVRA